MRSRTLPSRTLPAAALALGAIAALTAYPPTASAQRPVQGSAAASYVAVDAEIVALTGVTLIDGTGGAVQRGRTIVIEGNRITAVGPDRRVSIPGGASVLDMSGHTVIPGLVGLHNHLYYTAAGGRAAQLTYSAPRLYLGSGVTT
ncbi:MAG: hypothetical protein F4Z32_09080, partial [Gemmatimonadetes bacterium]|nr:hypothetical protein [Gemmatimonadota bacterium]